MNNADGIEAQITEKIYRGAEFLYCLSLPSGSTVSYLAPDKEDLAVGSTIPITLNTDRVIVISGDTAAAFKIASVIHANRANTAQIPAIES